MGDILKVVRVRKKDQFDSLDILVSVEKKNRPFSTKYEVVWFPSGETSTKYEYDSEDLNSETFSGTLNSAPITLTKKELVDRLLKNSDSPYIKLKANAYKDKYSRIGPAIIFLLSADKYLGIDELEGIITYGFNTSTWTEGDAFINETIKKKELEDKVKYEIIEDPYNKDNVPRIRRFGYDPYYLPNGAKVIVKWMEGDIASGGRKYSTNSGEELEESVYDGKKRSVHKKHAEIFSADDKEIFYLDENLKFTKELKWKEYVNVSDAVILSDVLDAWRAAIPGYSLPLGLTQEQQSVTYRRPSGTDYKSPFDPAPAPGVTQSATQSATQSNTGKIPIIVNLPQGVFKPKTDLPDFVLYIGKNAQKSDPFDFVEAEDVTDEQFTESDFAGQEETEAEEVLYPMSDERKADLNTESSSLQKNASQKEQEIIKSGKHDLDLIPPPPGKDGYLDNNKNIINLCAIDGSLVNILIAPSFLDMRDAAKRDGIIIKVSSGFRAPYDSIDAKSSKGTVVKASSQQYLYDGWIAKKPGFNLAAKPGGSPHGYGIGMDLNTGGKSQARFSNVDRKIYQWLCENSWKYGFVRSVVNEEWHFDYRPEKAKKGPYGQIAGTDANKFYSDWGLDKMTAPDWKVPSNLRV